MMARAVASRDLLSRGAGTRQPRKFESSGQKFLFKNQQDSQLQ
ncbi:hypothetical protein R2A130_0479 [Ahrensia sp. R2A130]|nr:hypothetical protein R2A130_0479 [Ahrensia sp. R2A130]